MERLNMEMRRCIQEEYFENFDTQYYLLNIASHDVILELSDNKAMKPLIATMKQRLYDFPRFVAKLPLFVIGLTQAAAGRYCATVFSADSARRCMLGLQTSETHVVRWQCGRS